MEQTVCTDCKRPKGEGGPCGSSGGFHLTEEQTITPEDIENLIGTIDALLKNGMLDAHPETNHLAMKKAIAVIRHLQRREQEALAQGWDEGYEAGWSDSKSSANGEAEPEDGYLSNPHKQ